MYKLLLCRRYLFTRYLAMVCIVSVMLGVATLIVVNSVMSGFSTKLQDRLHGLLSDVVVESLDYDGFPDPEMRMEEVRRSKVGNKIESMTPSVEVFAMLQFEYQGSWITKPVHLIGVDPEGRCSVGRFSSYLTYHKNDPNRCFQADQEAVDRYRFHHPALPSPSVPTGPDEKPAPGGWDRAGEEKLKPPPGVVVGNAIASFRYKPKDSKEPAKDVIILKPGDQITLMTASIAIPTRDGGQKIAPVRFECMVTDYFKSEMSEYDASYVFVPLDLLQELRGMNNYGERRVTSIQFKLKDYRDTREVVEELQRIFPRTHFQVQSWEDKQGPLLAAISIERGILNLLLFMIIAVAGFGILAIFSMIVSEKTRDIGILKALGASNGGVMNIFLGYGLLLGVVGVCLGTGLGLTITVYINEIEGVLTKWTGQEVFNREVYYFDKIPTNIQPVSVLLVGLGAVAISVLFSVLPALRAALLHPVRALRYE